MSCFNGIILFFWCVWSRLLGWAHRVGHAVATATGKATQLEALSASSLPQCCPSISGPGGVGRCLDLCMPAILPQRSGIRCALGLLGVEMACRLCTAVASGVAQLSVPVRSCAGGCLPPSHSSGQVRWHSGHGKLGTLHVPGQQYQQDNCTVHGILALWIRCACVRP
jgi:hypothetical protein